MSLFRANSARPAVAGIPVKYWPYITRHTIKYFYIANIIKYCPIALGLGKFFGGICFFDPVKNVGICATGFVL